jgi:hypothetical protein
MRSTTRRKPLPNQARLKELFSYDSETGYFTRLVATSKKRSGEVIKPKSPTGYLHIRVDGRSYFAHRLVWKFVTGEEPEIVDHIDGRPSNNRFSNLRAVTCKENTWNRTQRSPGTESESVGVYRAHGGTVWRACVRTPQGLIFIGPFKEAAQAVAARNQLIPLYRGAFHRKP